MPRPLVIVESPAKARTIGKFLGNGYMVEASIGHVRDLPRGAAEVPAEHRGNAWARLGVDVEHDFTPLYVVSDQKKDQVSRLKALLKDASMLYLATDEDREGESISWHLLEVLKPKVPVKRLVFHEITATAIQKALASPRAVDQNLVQAQETRRIVDRLYGYEVSPLLWIKVRPKLSAGRVQSVAVRLLVDRERARMAFRSAVWWDLDGIFEVEAGKLTANLIEVDGKRIATGKDFDETTGQLSRKDVVLLDEATARSLQSRIKGKTGKIGKVEAKPYRERPAAPFTTSTLQQEANRKLRFSARRTMQVAQKLYENGWITYMRTDSVALSDQAIAAARSLILRAYGQEYLPAQPRQYKNNAKNAQEAHEAIRPAGDTFRSLEDARSELENDESRLYEMIWKRTVACQMEDAVGKHISVTVEMTVESNRATFLATGKTIEFPGFRRAYVEGSDDPEAELADQERILPPVKPKDSAKNLDTNARSHTTQPPARLTEATLVKELESRGIGRPSTYASIIDTIIEREYVAKRGNTLVPTFTAFAVTRLMEQALPGLVDYSFTARMEDELDEIAMGSKDRLAMLHQFYNTGLIPTLKEAGEKVDPRQVCTIPIGENDGVEVAVRVGRYGPFLAAGKATAPITDETAPDEVSLAWALEQLAKKAEGPRALGNDTVGTPIFVMNGRFGPYVQRGEAKEGEKPPRASLMPGMDPSEVTLDTALKLLSFPKVLGTDPEGKEVVASNGKFGPYVKKGSESRSIPQNISLLDVTLEQALALFLEPARRGARVAPPLKELGVTAAGATIKVLSGRFGPYVSDGTINANLPKGIAPENLTREEAIELLEKRAAAGPSPKKGRKKQPDPMTARVVGEKKPRKTAAAAEGESKPRARKAKGTETTESAGAVSALPPGLPKTKVTKSVAPVAATEPAEVPKTPAKAPSAAASSSKAASPSAAKPRTSKKKAPPPPPPKPVMNNILTIKASKAGKEASPQASAPISALPPGLIRRK